MMPIGSSTDSSCLHGADRQNNLRLYIFYIFIHGLRITLTAAALPWFRWFYMCDYSAARFRIPRVSYLKVNYVAALLHEMFINAMFLFL